MTDNDHLQELFATARRAIPETSAFEYAFETRLLARLREDRESSIFSWAWRLCPFFALLALGLTWYSHTSPDAHEARPLFAQMIEEPDALGSLAGGVQ